MTHAPQPVTGTREGWLSCPCGNQTGGVGFDPSDAQGRKVDPAAGAWDGLTTVCRACGRIFHRHTGQILGARPDNPATAISTCQNCGGYLEHRGTWQHVTRDQVSLRCPGSHSRAEPVDPANSRAVLGIILMNLRMVGASDITLYDNAFEFSGPDNAVLLAASGSFTPAGLATWLGVPLTAITDQRTPPQP